MIGQSISRCRRGTVFGWTVLLLAGCLAAQEDASTPSEWSNSLGMEFVRVPAGEFVMGSERALADDDEKPLTRVKISRGFYLGKYEVTQGQWEAVMGSNPSDFKNCGRDCPVESVSWDDVQQFVRKLNGMEGRARYRLPTEAEWEYAARAGTRTDTPAGDLDLAGQNNVPMLDTIACDPSLPRRDADPAWPAGGAGSGRPEIFIGGVKEGQPQGLPLRC